MITWRTVQGPNQSGANQLATQGANTVSQGLQALGAALAKPQAQAKEEEAQQFARMLQLANLDQSQQGLDNQDRQHAENVALRKFLQRDSQGHDLKKQGIQNAFTGAQTDKQITANAVQAKADRDLRQQLHKSTQGHDLNKLSIMNKFTDSQRKAKEAYDTLARKEGYKNAVDMQNKGFTFENGKLRKMQEHEITMWNKGNKARVKAASLLADAKVTAQDKDHTLTVEQNRLNRKHRTSEREGSQEFTGEQNRLGREASAEQARLGREAANTRANNAVQAKIDAEKRSLANSKALAKYKASLGGSSTSSGNKAKASSASNIMKSPVVTGFMANNADDMSTEEKNRFPSVVMKLNEMTGDPAHTEKLVGKLFDSGYVYDSGILTEDVDFSAGGKTEKALQDLIDANPEALPPPTQGAKLTDAQRAFRAAAGK